MEKISIQYYDTEKGLLFTYNGSLTPEFAVVNYLPHRLEIRLFMDYVRRLAEENSWDRYELG